jgi:UDP-N-acetylmuramoyl-tripeptide--D-alanyl-D-alanine ligase
VIYISSPSSQSTVKHTLDRMNTLDELHRAVGGDLDLAAGSARNPRATCVGPVAIDSRRIEPGDVFWALAGPDRDGSDFVEDAFGRGAAGAVVGRTVAVPEDRWIIRVDDTQRALERWAARTREKFAGQVIAVTGSVGKTTTRQMIHTVLSTRLRGTASPRNYNNHIGLPLSMLPMEPSHDYAVLELGASGAGEIAALAELCRPTIGVITQVADAHLAGFGSRLGVAQAKAELLAALPPNGHALMGDDPLLRRLAACSPAPVTWVGRGVDCDITAADVRSTGGRLCFSVDGCPFAVPVWGRHHLTSALLAVAVSRLLGFELEEISAALEQFESIPMRCEVTHVDGTTIINDAYNANPHSMQAAFELLRDFDTPGRRIVVCGDMAELGAEAPRYHQRLGAEAVTVCGADALIACGKYAYEVVAGARTAGMPRSRSIPCQTPSDALPFLQSMMAPGDVVLVKGSRWLNMERLIQSLQQHPQRRSA